MLSCHVTAGSSTPLLKYSGRPLARMDVLNYFNVIVSPKKNLEEEIKKVNYMEALKSFALFGLVTGLLLGIIIALATSVPSLIGAALLQDGGTLQNVGLAAIVVLPVVLITATLIITHILVGINWLLARVLGGKGTFQQNYYIQSRLLWPNLILFGILFILMIIPIVGLLALLGLFIFSLYINLHLYIRAISIANSISMRRGCVVDSHHYFVYHSIVLK